MPPDPAVVADLDLARVFDVVASRLDLGLVGGGEDADEGAEHYAVTDGYKAAVEDYRAG